MVRRTISLVPLLTFFILKGELDSQTLSSVSADDVSTQKTSNDLKRGSIGCPCLTLDEATIANPANSTPFLDQEADRGYSFPDRYGSGICEAHDKGTKPFCDSSPDVYPGNPDWCHEEWCYVDPNNCSERNHKSRNFPNSDLYFSYHTCGTSNSFLIWLGNNTDHSFTDLIGLLERYLVSTKTAQENSIKSVRSKVQDAMESGDRSDIEQECLKVNDCDACQECSASECWAGSGVNFESTSLIMSPENLNATTQLELDTLACHSVDLSTSFVKISDHEYDDESRLGFQYYGDQITGGYVQWPVMESMCRERYDPRFRPWYASALSGAKDIVVVIDVSGSMKAGNKIDLAAEGAKAVLRTLTWVDYFSIITFSNVITSAFPESSDTLLRATFENVNSAFKHIDKFVQADTGISGTKFLEPLQKAYRTLSYSEDNPRCSQAILFLTDGRDPDFEIEDLELEMENKPNVVVFGYSLGKENSQTEKLHHLTCATNGIFRHIDNEDAITLPDVMASYYEYFVQLQDTCHITWVNYLGVFTWVEYLAGCTAIFDFKEGNGLRSVLGVTCIDLGLVVDMDILKSCTSGGFDDFLEVARQESQDCARRTEMDPCVLAHLRERVNSTCSVFSSDYYSASNCTLPPQPTSSNCSHLDPQRLKHIDLSGCPTPDADAMCERTKRATAVSTSSAPSLSPSSESTPSLSPSSGSMPSLSPSSGSMPSLSPSSLPPTRLPNSNDEQGPDVEIDFLHIVLIVVLSVVFVGVTCAFIVWKRGGNAGKQSSPDDTNDTVERANGPETPNFKYSMDLPSTKRRRQSYGDQPSSGGSSNFSSNVSSVCQIPNKERKSDNGDQQKY